MVTGIAAAAGNNLGPLIELVGAVFFSILGLVIPAVVNIVVHHEIGYGVGKWRLVKDILIIILAMFGLVSGSYYAIQDFGKWLQHKFMQEKFP